MAGRRALPTADLVLLHLMRAPRAVDPAARSADAGVLCAGAAAPAPEASTRGRLLL